MDNGLLNEICWVKNYFGGLKVYLNEWKQRKLKRSLLTYMQYLMKCSDFYRMKIQSLLIIFSAYDYHIDKGY